MANLYTSADHADDYKKYRPSYPKEVYTSIMGYLNSVKPAEQTLAVDLGCGGGQSTLPLTEHFTRVIGMDVSSQQLKQAPQGIKGLSFQEGSAEDLSRFSAGSVDLITIAQAAHWLNLDKFYEEVRRVLRPCGVLAVFGYGNAHLTHPAANDLITKLYRETLVAYWEPDRYNVDNCYRDIILPFDNFTRVDDHAIQQEMTLHDFVGFLRSQSGYRNLFKKHPDNTVLQEIYSELLECYSTGEDGRDPVISVSWPVFILLGRKS